MDVVKLLINPTEISNSTRDIKILMKMVMLETKGYTFSGESIPMGMFMINSSN